MKKYNNLDVISVNLWDQIVIDNKVVLLEYEVKLSNGDSIIVGSSDIKNIIDS